MNKKACFSINPAIMFRQEGKEALLHNPQNGDTKCINETGTFIYKLCDRKYPKDRIIAEALKCYKGNKKRIESETNSFLKDMLKSGILEVK